MLSFAVPLLLALSLPTGWSVAVSYTHLYLNRYNAAIKFLTLVAEGTVSIGTETEDPASAAAGGFKVKSNSRLFTREKMRGM